MSSVSPGERVVVKEPSDIQIQAVDSPEIITALTALLDIFSLSYGPLGQASVLHNNCGGSLTLTTSSTRLINISVSKPVVKLLLTALQEHAKINSDGGLLTAILTLQLTLKALALKVSRRLVIETYNYLLGECIDYFESEDCPCKVIVSFDDVDILLKLIRSLYTSKPCCLLFNQDLDHMCRLTLDGYIKSMNTSTSSLGTLLYVSFPGKPVQESSILPGILFEAPQIPVYRKMKLKVKEERNHIVVVLVETSMAGDCDAYADVRYELAPGLKLADPILETLLGFAGGLAESGVGLLACQRVVHPKVKKLLKECDVLVLDRLGKKCFDTLHTLAGGMVINPFSPQALQCLSSRLGSVRHVVLYGKSYVHMEGVHNGSVMPATSLVHTVLLCHRSEEAAAEIKELYKNAQHTLGVLARQPQVLCGGGCWQTALSLFLQNQIGHLVEKWKGRLGSSKTHLEQIIHQFIHSIEASATTLNRSKALGHVVDCSTGHHFLLQGDGLQDSLTRCQCRAVTYDHASDLVYEHLGKSSYFHKKSKLNDKCELNHHNCDIIDAFLPCLNALSTAVGISSTVLGIQNCVTDTN